MTEYIQVFTTIDSHHSAEAIAKSMIEQRLAACVQITGPIKSLYRWEGQIESAEEWLLILKSRDILYKELEKGIKEMHSYDVPEIIAVPVVAGSSTYLDWVAEETKL